jgi:uncharacterized Zn-binding protein involved in type VI secretion
MAKISRVGDTNQEGGAIQRGAGTVFANGKQVGLKGSQLSAHAPYGKRAHPPHASATVTAGSPTVFAEGTPVARVGSSNSCGHSMVQGSDNVFVP